MKLTIHHGAHEIGGSCVEIKTSRSRIIMDVGIPLTDDKGKEIKFKGISRYTADELIKKKLMPNVPGLYSGGKTDIDAILISHSHLDHYGFMPFVNLKIPVYMSRGCKDIIGAANYFDQTKYNPEKANGVLPWKPFKVGNLTMTPYLMDHSAFDAFAYLVEGEGKRVFYSGDFRGHGNKDILFKNMVTRPPEDLDALIVEGTMLGRDETIEEGSEKSVLDKFIDEFDKRRSLILISVSSQNIDRITSIYRACLKTGKTFVISPYAAEILRRIKREGITIPQFDWDNMRVFFAQGSHTDKLKADKSLYRYLKKKIEYEEIEDKKGELVILDSFFVRTQFAKKGWLAGATLLFSQWDKYLDDQEDFWKKNKCEVVKIHSSGHAYEKELKQFVRALDPGTVIPIHTLHPEKFAKLFGDKVKLLANGESYQL